MTKKNDFRAQVYAVVEEHVAAVHQATLERLRAELATIRTARGEAPAGAGADETSPPRRAPRSSPSKTKRTKSPRRRGPSTSSGQVHKPRGVKPKAAAAPAAGSTRPSCSICEKPGHNARTCPMRVAAAIAAPTSVAEQMKRAIASPPTQPNDGLCRADGCPVLELHRVGEGKCRASRRRAA